MQETTQTPDRVDMGAWVGRQQAFAVIANKCSAAQALSLKQMKETGCHDQLGLSWDDFCERYVGLDRRQADRIISHYKEFGEAYFRLSSLARISAEDYREIAAAVEDSCIEIDGEQVPIAPENASRIRAFIRARRSQRPSSRRAYPADLSDLNLRQKALLSDFKRHVQPDLHDKTRAPTSSISPKSPSRTGRPSSSGSSS
jgi:hypothetical protein